VEVELKLDSWQIELDQKTKQPKIVGKYLIEAMGKTVADQSFNGSYGGLKFPFSGDLVKKVEGLEKEILAEIKASLG